MTVPTPDEITDWPPERKILFKDAVTLMTLGWPIIPVGADKTPFIKWAKGDRNYVTEPANLQDALAWSNDARIKGWAALMGDKALGLFTIDVEVDGMHYPEISGLFSHPLLPTSCQRNSPSGGRHAVCVVTDGDPVHTQALARIDGVLLAEIRGVSRGEGNGAYAMITGPGRGNLPDDFTPAQVTRAQIDPLLAMVRALHQPTERERKVVANRAAGTAGTGPGGGTGQVIADAIIARDLGWLDILEPGWTISSTVGDRIGLCRGAEAKSDESGNAIGPVLVIHSSAVDWAPTSEPISAPQALAACLFDGDFAAAMRHVEEAAAVFAMDGVLPADFMATWKPELLQRIHDQRISDRQRWRDKEQAESEGMIVAMGFDKSTVINHADPAARLRPHLCLSDRILGRDQLSSLPKPDPLIHGTIDRLTVAALVGDTGTLKTFLALDWAACIATGKRWHGREVERGSILYVASEGAYGLDQRITEWEYVNGIAIDPAVFKVFPAPVQLANDHQRRELAAFMADTRPDVTFFDTIARCAVGRDENSAKDMGLLVDALYRLREASAGTVVALHHTGKDGKTTRGSSAFEDGVDTVYLTKGDATLIELERTKRKDGPTEDRRRFTLKVSTATENGYLELVSGFAMPDNPVAWMFLLTRIDSHFGDAEVTMSQILEISDASKATVYRLVKQAIDAGKLVNVGTTSRRRFALVRVSGDGA